jgi:uncharacterized protein (DUF1800 family)
MVKRIAKVFNSSQGNLAKTVRAIVEDPEFHAERNFRAKFKRPWEFVVSALRVTGAEIAECEGLYHSLTLMNEALYRCADPTGYYDQAEAWRDPGAMATRWTFASGLAANRIPGVKIPSSFFEGDLVQKVLPVAGVGAETAAAVDKAREPVRRLALLLGSPEFQKQ